MYRVENGKILNEGGEVAIRWNQLTQKYVKVGENEYIFVIKADIALAWVKPEDEQKVLGIRKTCCGGNLSPACHLASELDVKRWLGISIW